MKILFSILVAIILQMVPISSNYSFFRPDFVALILIFWLIYAPHVISPYAIFCLGLFCDVAYGYALGEHSVSFLLTSYLVYRLLRPLRVWPLWQQFSLILVILFANHSAQLVTKLLQGYDFSYLHGFWIAPMVGLVFWPLIRNLMFNFAPKMTN